MHIHQVREEMRLERSVVKELIPAWAILAEVSHLPILTK